MAVALIDAARIDERYIPLTISLLNHAAERGGRNAQNLFDEAASLAAPPTAEAMRAFVRQSAEYKSIQESWGYDEVHTSIGSGFAQRGFDEYQPTHDLTSVAIAVRNILKSDRYDGDVTIASELPAVWFHSSVREEAERILANTLGTAAVHGALRAGEHERADVQSLLVFITEARSANEAATLASLAQRVSPDPATLALHADSLFLLAVGRSFEDGVPSYESVASLKRFEEAFQSALEIPRG